MGAVAVPAAGAAEMLELEVSRDGNRYFVDSRTLIRAPMDTVYDVLSDYEHLHELSSVIEESRVVSRDEGRGEQVVYSRLRGCVLFFCRAIERYERLTLDRPGHIRARAINPPPSAAPADDGTGGHAYSVSSWELTPGPDGGTEVVYSLEMEPDFWVPPLVGPWALKRKLASGAGDAATRVEQRALGQPVVLD